MTPTLRLALLLVLLRVTLHAQTPNIVSYQLSVYAPGVSPVTGSPISTTTYQAGAAVCNQTLPIVPAAVVNPTRFFFDDPANPGKACIVPLNAAVLPGLPNGVGYTTTLTQTDNLGQVSGASAASNPFNKQGIPPVLTNLHLVG